MFKTPHGGDLMAYSKALGVNPSELLDFSANVNPLGLHPKIKQAIINSIDNCHNYPDPNCTLLTDKLSALHGVRSESIVCGNGAADVIFRCVLGLKPKKALIIAPTFSEYEKALEAADCEICHYILTEDNGFSLTENVISAIDVSVDMVFICNPNNPTGVIYPVELMLKIAEHCKDNNTVLFVDECFIDFVVDGEMYSLIPYAHLYPSLVILKAFTKMYSMAGVRLGYAVCSNPQIISKMYRSAQHWSVSNLAMEAGAAALSLPGYAKNTALATAEERCYIINELNSLGFKTYNSTANYVFFKTSTDNLQELLAKKNIIIRSCQNYIGLDEYYYRIGIKLTEQNKRLLSALKEVIILNP